MNQGELAAKQRILQAAKMLFAKQGFDATSLRQICETAGANTALVSYHFGGKEQLFKAIYEYYYRPERYGPFFQLMGDPRAALKAFISSIVGYRFEEPELMAITSREMSTRSNRAEMIRGCLLPVWELLQQILEEGRKLSVFRFESMDYAMTSIMGMVLFPPHTMVVEPLLEKPIKYEDMSKYITLYVFRMLEVPEHAEGDPN